MSEPLPAFCLIAVPGRRRRTIELCQEAERRGYRRHLRAEPVRQHVDVRGAGVEHRVDHVRHRHRADLPAHHRRFRAECRDDARGLGRPLPAGHRHRARAVACAHGRDAGQAAGRHARLHREVPRREIVRSRCRRSSSRRCASGWWRCRASSPRAWCSPTSSLSHMGQSLAALPAAKRNDAGLLHRQHDPDLHQRRRRGRQGGQPAHAHQLRLPAELPELLEGGRLRRGNGRRSRRRIAEGRRDDVPKYLSDKWLADNTLFGPAAKVREGVAAWRAAGVHTPILVPSSAAGNQMKAIEEVFAAFG